MVISSIITEGRKKFLRLPLMLNAVIGMSLLVLISKIISLSTLYSATGHASTSGQEHSKPEKEPPTDPPELPTENIALDNKGLTLKLDFMNLTSSDIKVLESLFKYREKLEQKAGEVLKREDQLTIVEERMQQQLTELKRLQAELKKLIDIHDEQEEKKLLMLVKIYENMKPDQAAQIFGSLQEERVLAILQRMKEAKSAAILANMQPSQASYLTDKLMGQKELKN